MKITNPCNRAYLIQHLERGSTVKTEHGHYALARNGLVYVSESGNPYETVNAFISHSTPLTWDSFLHLYLISGDILAAHEGRLY